MYGMLAEQTPEREPVLRSSELRPCGPNGMRGVLDKVVDEGCLLPLVPADGVDIARAEHNVRRP